MRTEKNKHDYEKYYQKIKEIFTQEASSLITEEMLQKTLADEKKCLQHAESLRLSPAKTVAGNMLQHCKNMLRKKQPFYAFYLLLNFLTELSTYLLFFGIILCTVSFFLSGSVARSFSAPFPFLYAAVVIAGILLYFSLRRYLLRKFLLAQDFPKNSPVTDKTLQKQKNFCLFMPLFLICILCLFLLLALKYSGLALKYQATLFQLFMGYVFWILLSGIHNTLYSSHLIPFLSVGGFLLTKRSRDDIQHAAAQYEYLCSLQILRREKKTSTDWKQDTALAAEIKKTLRARLVTQRIYCALAVFILITLLIICLRQISLTFSLMLFLFSGAVLLAAVLFITAFCSANYLIHRLPK